MNRVFIYIGGFNIYWYSFLIFVAVLVGYEIAVVYSKKLKYSTLDVMDMLFLMIIWGIIGARLYYVIFNFDAFRDNFLDIFKVWEGGLAIYGGIIGGSLYILYRCYKKKLSFIKILDIYSLSLLLGQAIGRWGNFFNSEAYGGITSYDSLKRMMLPEFIIKGMYIDGAYREPLFLYESIWCLIGVIFIILIRKQYEYKEGRQIGFYLFWYGLGRFVIEWFRSDSLYIGKFKVSQVLSLILCIVGLVSLIVISGKSNKRLRKSKNKSVSDSSGRISFKEE